MVYSGHRVYSVSNNSSGKGDVEKDFYRAFKGINAYRQSLNPDLIR